MKLLLILAAAILCQPAGAALRVFASVPEWGALAREIGRDRVEVFVATHARQDPHRIQARPSLIAQARNADLVVATGAELEIGWLPLVLRESGNASVQPGREGYFEAARHVELLGLPTRLDRADGDVHASGNPHIQTDPRNIRAVGAALVERMAKLAPADAASFAANWRDFVGRWDRAIAGWEKRGAPLRGSAIVVQHDAFPYLERWLGLTRIATLEPKAGVDPSVQHLQRVVEQTAGQRPRLVLRASYQSAQATEWFARASGARIVVLPFTVGGSEGSGDLFGLFDETLDLLGAGPR